MDKFFNRTSSPAEEYRKKRSKQGEPIDAPTLEQAQAFLSGRRRYSRIATRHKRRRRMENALIVCLVVALFLRLFIINTSLVYGYSMNPTLYEGERVVLFKAAYAFARPQRFDVVAVQFPGEQQRFIKRVIGLPGETVELRGKEGIFIDGEKLDGDIYGEGYNPRVGLWQLDFRSYFVMGDNRAHSTDSAMLGGLHEDDILGKALLVYWPLGSQKLL